MEVEAKCSTLGQVWELYDLRKARNMPRVNSLMLLTGALIAFVAAISCFAPRYRHHPIVGLFFLAANTLFLPIISLVAATLGEDDLFPTEVKNAAWDCKMSSNMLLVMMWTGLSWTSLSARVPWSLERLGKPTWTSQLALLPTFRQFNMPFCCSSPATWWKARRSEGA